MQAAWASLSLCVLCHALACERGALLRLLQDDEEEGDVLRQLQEAARQLHRSAHLGAAHRALLCGARGLRGSRERLVVALEVWSLRTALLQEVRRGQSCRTCTLHAHDLLLLCGIGAGTPPSFDPLQLTPFI